MAASPDPHFLAAELRTVVARLVKKLRSHSAIHGTLSLTERAVLKLLEQHEFLLPSELAAREKVTTQAMSQILRHLTELGYITRQPAATDKRKVLVGLSAQGQALLPAVRQQTDEWLEQALQVTCSPEQLELLRQALPILHQVVEAD